MKKNILITGMPRSGKSTLLKKIITLYDPKIGFVTNEVRENGERVGFEIETNTGIKSLLASVNFNTPIKVSRYFVDISKLDVILSEVKNFSGTDFLYLDEIGQMELYSEKFKGLVENYLNSHNICMAVLSEIYSDSFTEYVKNRDDTILVKITPETRDEKEKYLATLVGKIEKARRYCSEPSRFTLDQNEASIITDHGVRRLMKQKGAWACNCDFFQNNTICSHVMALEEYLKN